MKIKIITALILIGSFIGVLFLSRFSPYFLISLAAVAAAFSFIEITKAREESKKWPIGIKIFVLVVGMLMIFWTFILNWLMSEYQLDFSDGARIPTLGLISVFIILFLMTIIYKEFEISDATYVFTLTIFITLGCQSFLYLALKHTYVGENIMQKLSYPKMLLPLFFVMFITYMADTGGYIIGYFFGKKKINPRISPKKTVEGAIGATLFGIAGSFLFAFIPALQMTYYNWIGTIMVGVVLSLGAQFGDFMFSAIKRHYKIKDFSNIIPGHGGILDRIDSLMVNGMVFMVIDVLVFRYNSSGYQDLIKFIVELFTK